MRPLTPKQEAFAHKYVETGNASEAYRFAYDVERMSLPAIHVAASRLLDHATVALKVSELQQQALAVVDVSAQDIVRRAWEIAQQDRNDRVSALALLARRHPEFSDKRDINVSERSETLLMVASMSPDELRKLAAGADADA